MDGIPSPAADRSRQSAGKVVHDLFQTDSAALREDCAAGQTGLRGKLRSAKLFFGSVLEARVEDSSRGRTLEVVSCCGQRQPSASLSGAEGGRNVFRGGMVFLNALSKGRLSQHSDWRECLLSNKLDRRSGLEGLPWSVQVKGENQIALSDIPDDEGIFSAHIPERRSSSQHVG